MNIQNRFQANHVIIDIMDNQFSYPETIELKKHAAQLLDDGYSRLVINLSHITHLDSFGLAALISVLKLCQEKKSNLSLFGLNEQGNHLIALTRMDRILDIWETEGQAVYQVTSL